MKAGVENNVKIAMIPLGKDKVLLRLGNMIDSKDQTAQVNLDEIINGLWQSSNAGVSIPQYQINETSVTGNILLQEMNDRRLKWKTDVKPKVFQRAQDSNEEHVIQI